MKDQSLPRTLDEILIDLISLTAKNKSRNSILQSLVELCHEAFKVKACNLAETDLKHRFIKLIAYFGFDDKFYKYLETREVKPNVVEKSVSLNYDLINQHRIIERYNLQEDGGGVANVEIAREYGLNSALCCRLKKHSQSFCFLNIFSEENKPFTDHDKELLKVFAQQAEIIFERFESSQNLKVLEKINSAALDMVKANNVEKIYNTLLRTSIDITNAKYGLIRQLNHSEGQLEVVAKRGISQAPPLLRYGQGITWKALMDGKIQMANDVNSIEWKDIYFENVPETHSELAVPLLVEQVRVREGRKVKLSSRPLGVLNLENPEIRAFSQKDITALQPLIRQASLILDAKEAGEKLKGLMEIDKELVNKRNREEVLEIIAKGIKGTLNFEWVNISLVSQAGRFIKSHHVLGLNENDAKEFKDMSNHSLDDSDIQSDIVRTKDVEVIRGYDPRFDKEMYNKFGHENLIRVFVPIVAPSTGEVIGTVEAGHRKDYRDFIDERDVSFLRAMIANAAEVIDPQQRNLLARIRHELTASIVGIRSNADFLRLLRHRVREDIIENKLSDILTDCDVLLLNVEEIEFILGQPTQEWRIEEVFFIRDIIIKTVQQLKRHVKDRGFSTKNIQYPTFEARKFKIYVEKAKLNQVVNNLLTNAIKYAKIDPADFKVEITIDESPNEFIIKISDWGIGIKDEDTNKIFKLGFRSSEAIALDINGSGLGLVIAKDRIREIGGELLLINNSNPTTFQFTIPTSLMEKPK